MKFLTLILPSVILVFACSFLGSLTTHRFLYRDAVQKVDAINVVRTPSGIIEQYDFQGAQIGTETLGSMGIVANKDTLVSIEFDAEPSRKAWALITWRDRKVTELFIHVHERINETELR